MNLSLSGNFNELTYDEQMDTDGGGWPLVVGLIIVILFVACSTKGCADADNGK